ncbi:MAG: DinB family protein [Nocardioidaceae bacterium]
MTWIAPDVTPVPAPPVADDYAALDAELDHQRQTLLHICSGLSPDQLKTRSAAPSSLSLLGLVRHLAGAERWWFRINFAGMELDDLYFTEGNPEGEFDDVDDADPAEDFGVFATEVELARQVVAGRSLDERFWSASHPLVDRPPIELDLRWVFVHLIAEYARHNGHADLLRERLDGVRSS